MAAVLGAIALALVSANPATAWRFDWMPEPQVQSGGLDGVSCLPGGTCMAVGHSVNSWDHYTAFSENWDGGRWTIRMVPPPRRGHDVQLHAVSCAAPDACEAVGSYYLSKLGMFTVAERWDGRRWTVQPTPAPSGSDSNRELESVSCATENSCAAVGDYETPAGPARLGEVWDGHRWTIYPLPTPRMPSNLIPPPRGSPLSPVQIVMTGVSCTAAHACIAVGSASADTYPETTEVAFADRWDGHRWSLAGVLARVVAFPSIRPSVSCPAANACVAVGTYITFVEGGPGPGATFTDTWNGKRWTVRNSSPGNARSVISCVSASACTALGGWKGGEGTELWDGRRWSIRRLAKVPGSGGAPTFVALSCTRAACLTVGSYDDREGYERAIAERQNTGRWTLDRVSSPLIGELTVLSSVSCNRINACMAVGVRVTPFRSSFPLAERWDGARWTVRQLPTPRGMFQVELNSVSCPAANRCVAVGDYSIFTSSIMPTLTLIERWDGKRWTIQRSPNPRGATTPPSPPNGYLPASSLSAVSCSRVNACLAIGRFVTAELQRSILVESWNGKRWRLAPAAPWPTLSVGGLSCRSPSSCVAIGNDGPEPVAIWWNGKSWTWQEMATPPPAEMPSVNLTGVSCATPDACTAVGTYSLGSEGYEPTRLLSEQWDGRGWTLEHAPQATSFYEDTLLAVSCARPRACLAVGTTVRHGVNVPLVEAWNGRRWHIGAVLDPSPRSEDATLASLSCASRTACVALGSVEEPVHLPFEMR